jgi:hypothetical protein
MSANNILYILKNKKGEWIIEEHDVDTGAIFGKFPPSLTLQEAIKKANEYCENNVVEYGYKVIL